MIRHTKIRRQVCFKLMWSRKNKGDKPHIYKPGVKDKLKSQYKEEVEMKEGEWADEKRKEKESSDRLLKIHKEREARYQAQQRKKKQTKEGTEIDEWVTLAYYIKRVWHYKVVPV